MPPSSAGSHRRSKAGVKGIVCDLTIYHRARPQGCINLLDLFTVEYYFVLMIVTTKEGRKEGRKEGHTHTHHCHCTTSRKWKAQMERQQLVEEGQGHTAAES